MLEIGTDFSGCGAFEQALLRLKIPHRTIFACDNDKYARETYIKNYGKPGDFPNDVYERKIPAKPLDIYVATPPCQSFSMAGKRGGEDDLRGILFYNSHEFIVKNKPKYFIFENVRGLMSDNKGQTFQTWVDMLGGKSVNGQPVIFPNEDSVPYHLYYKIMNAKKYGVPQNRERVFLIGIRNDEDNNFHFPVEEPLTKKLADILEKDVDPKYDLSEKMLELLSFNDKVKGVIGDINKGGERGEVFSENSDHMSCLTATDYKQPKQVLIKTATKKGYETAQEGDAINFTQANSKTRRGRVGKEVSQTIETKINQGTIVHNIHGGFGETNPRIFEDYSPTIRTAAGGGHIPSTMDNFRIRKLTPRECFRLMDFPDSFTWDVSNTQAYKMAGNSVVVKMYELLIKKLLS